jgi:hypothetical protein
VIDNLSISFLLLHLITGNDFNSWRIYYLNQILIWISSRDWINDSSSSFYLKIESVISASLSLWFCFQDLKSMSNSFFDQILNELLTSIIICPDQCSTGRPYINKLIVAGFSNPMILRWFYRSEKICDLLKGWSIRNFWIPLTGWQDHLGMKILIRNGLEGWISFNISWALGTIFFR